MPNTDAILTENQIAEIEVVMHGDDFEAKYIAANVENVIDLCKTVRAAWAELTTLQSYTRQFEKSFSRLAGLDPVAHLGDCYLQIESKLAQVEQERNRWESRAKQLGREVQDLERGNSGFRTRAIQLCRDKAAGWSKASNDQWDERPDLAFDAGEKVKAANEIREGLERLT